MTASASSLAAFLQGKTVLWHSSDDETRVFSTRSLRRVPLRSHPRWAQSQLGYSDLGAGGDAASCVRGVAVVMCG